MRRYILLFIALCIYVAARGQTVLDDLDLSWLPQPTQAKALRYWIDDDIGSLQTTNILNGQHTVDVSSLLDGLHTIHYQIIDSEDKVAAPYSHIFLKMNERTDIPSTAATLRYWFDDDTNVSICDANVGSQVLDVSTLFDGLHTLHYQVVDTEDKVSYIASAIFLKMEATQGSDNVTAERLIYWFDDEESTTSVEMISGVMSLDASNLSDGLHTIHYLVACSDGSVTSAYSSIFLRMNIDIILTTAQSLRYWFDDETDVTVTEIAQGTQILNASHLSDGLHTVHYQVVDNSGAVTAPASGIFLKIEHGDEAVTTAQSLRYWFDDETNVKIINVASGTQTLDVSDLLAGLHTLHYQIVDSKGQLASTYSGIFLKMFDKPVEDGQNGITKYQYWLNDNSKAMQTVTFDEATNPYTLIALLPIQKEPFRSSCFHFENKDSKPMIYAKNDFHIRFHDAANYWADESRQFIDYSISREVKPVGELQTKQTFEKVAENDVRWYTMQVAPGDTTAFKLSQAATVQVFAPSSQEVFKTSESSSVQWSGIHTWEEGTYYLAVHDVTGSQENMTLEYMHMDKYDVVDWDVHTVGNGGCSTITFKGNGFRDLYAVDLVVAPGDTIRSVDVSHDSDAETAITFDFTGATLGDYNAVFHFTEEDKHFANIVTVEEAVDIELATDVTFPSSFLRGTSTTYTIRITNKGNMTAYRVPIYAYISSETLRGISHINVQGLNLKKLYDYIENKDSIDKSIIMEVKTICDSIGDDHYFNKYVTTDEVSGNNIIVRSGFFTIDLPPDISRAITFEIQSTEKINVWLTIPKEWHNIILDENVIAKSRMDKSAKDWFCCYHERLECLASIVVDVADFVGMVPSPTGTVATIVSCLTGATNQLIKSTANVLCNEKNDEKNWVELTKSIANGISIMGTLFSCASGLVKDIDLQAFFSATSFWIFDTSTSGNLGIDCYTAWTEKKPNCPPDPGGGGGSSTPQPPSDPNDIFGYLSEAGSKFIADSVARVNYTIEFENDTTFATAAAHTIVIKDTLDTRYFDLTKFMPTGIRIGEHETFLNDADIVTKNNVTSFVKTIDMRPEINAIAQVDGTFSHTTGIAEWRFTSLDPMTMEPTDDLMQGILPVNYNGTSGIGEVMFEIGVKQGKADGTELKNRAGIIFDYEATILTPTWTNIVDAEAPSSFIDDFEVVNDTILRINVDGFDNRSGIWKYELHAQYGENAPWCKISESDSTSFDFRFYDDIDYGFCVLATDSAGNVEKKVIQREFIFKAHEGDYEDTIEEVPATAVETEDSYDVSGRKVGRKAKGVIIRHSDGTTRKVLIKE